MRPDDWSALGHGEDPVPGDAAAVSSAATAYNSIAVAIKLTAETLHNIAGAGCEGMDSEAVRAIVEQADGVADRILRAHRRYEGVASALAYYATPFAEAQAWSVNALDQAVAARASLSGADDDAEFYLSRLQEPDLTDAQRALYQDRFDDAQRDQSALSGSLEGAVLLLQSAISHRDSAATSAASSIEEVESSGDLNDSWWDNTVQFIEEHKDIIDRVVEIVGFIATVAMLVAICIPGLNAIVGIILLVATIVQVANAIVQGLAGTMSPSEAIFTVGMAALTFVGGKLVSSLATRATRTTVGTAVRNSYSGSGMSGMTQQRALNMVDTAGAFGDVRNLSLTQRILNMGTDYRTVAQLDSMANVQLLSGRHATGAATALNSYSAYNAASRASDFAMNGINVSDKVGSLTEGSTWRAGGNW